jgi:hypothetical protein
MLFLQNLYEKVIVFFTARHVVNLGPTDINVDILVQNPIQNKGKIIFSLYCPFNADLQRKVIYNIFRLVFHFIRWAAPNEQITEGSVSSKTLTASPC